VKKLTKEQNEVSWKADIWELPANSTLVNLISNVNWSELDAVIKSGMEELSAQLMSVPKYFDVAESNISTSTLSLLLDPALSQAKESGRNFINGLIRVVGICLTLGIAQGIFPAFGTYQAGDFKFDVDSGEVFAMSAVDRASLLSQLKLTGIALQEAMEMSGYTQAEIDKAVAGV
jgi:hypothetical protein